MKRAALPLLTLGLFAIVVADRLSHAVGPRPTAPLQGPSETRPATVDLAGTAGGKAPRDVAAPAASDSRNRQARLAARQQLSREGTLTYLDSLILSTDSV